MTEARTKLAEALRIGESELARHLAELDRICRRRQHSDWFAPLPEGTALLRLVPDREAAQTLAAAFGQTTWPGSFGETPYDQVMVLIRCALDGLALKAGATPAEKNLHLIFLGAYALPAARVRWGLSQHDLSQRYPRLLRAMQHGALLSAGEAEAALSLLLRRHPAERAKTPPSSEAVAHFGGNLKVVHAARRWQQRFASTTRLSKAA